MRYDKDARMLQEAYAQSTSKDRFELKAMHDGYIIIDHSKKAPMNVIARYDADEKEAAQSRYDYLSKQLSKQDIRQGFNDLRRSLQSDIT